MPAVDPQLLDRQLEELKSLAHDPAQLALHVSDLIEQYTDRTRAGTLLRSRVPRPVLRSMRTVLQQAVESDRAATAEVLWRIDATAAKLLAISLLEAKSGSEVPRIAARWGGQRVRLPIVQELGERGLTGWHRANEGAFLEQVETWLGGKSRRHRVLALYALRGAALDTSFEALPNIYRTLRGQLSTMRGEYLEAMRALVVALARVAPNETAHFLSGEAEVSPREVSALVRKLPVSLETAKSSRVV